MVSLDRAQRREQILNVLQLTEGAVTTYKLAKLVGMKPSPHFRALVYELYQEGKVQGAAVTLRNGRKAYYWSKSPLPQQIELEW